MNIIPEHLNIVKFFPRDQQLVFFVKKEDAVCEKSVK